MDSANKGENRDLCVSMGNQFDQYDGGFMADVFNIWCRMTAFLSHFVVTTSFVSRKKTKKGHIGCIKKMAFYVCLAMHGKETNF